MTITYYIKNVYGNETMYVADKNTALAIQTISKEISLTSRTMTGLKELGFSFEEVLKPR